MYSPQVSPRMLDYPTSGAGSPEKIVICVDSMCRDQEVKTRIRQFLELKCLINQHEIAVMLMTNAGKVEWLCDFTTNIKTVMSSFNEGLQKFEYRYRSPPESFDMSEVFTTLLSQCEKKFWDKATTLRLIIFYSRIHCEPVMSSDTALLQLKGCFSFIIDVLYNKFIRNAYVSEWDQQKALNVWRSLVLLTDNQSYVFFITGPKKLITFTLRLLAHPHFRPPLKELLELCKMQ